MNDQGRKVYGYLIVPDVQVDIIHNIIINIKNINRERCISVLTLRTTMMRLFIYLLENANGAIIENEDILINVWDKYGLSSSSQRLWQVMSCLRKKLSVLGVSDDFITRIETEKSKGFYIRKNQVIPLYY